MTRWRRTQRIRGSMGASVFDRSRAAMSPPLSLVDVHPGVQEKSRKPHSVRESPGVLESAAGEPRRDGLTPMRFAAILALMILPQAAPPGEPAETIFVGARGCTGDPANPRFDALAVKAGRILAVGARDAVLAAHRGPKTALVDLKDGFVYPGFIDAHAHFASLGRLKRQLDARGTKSFEEMVALAKER